MDRRAFLRRAVVASAGGAVAPNLLMLTAGAQTASPGESPYGPLATEPDENGLLLPAGFTSRIVAVAGEPVGPSGHTWPAFPDGAATFPTDDGGWIHTVNSEVFDFIVPAAGGVSAVRYSADGEIVDAYPILQGSHSNCAGGPTPWGTWLSCEESLAEQGLVWECDPTGEREAVAHEAMGRWAHEAVAVDPEEEILYLTEDHPAGLVYRYTPDAYPDLSAGVLEACIVAEDGSITWGPLTDPSGATVRTRDQVPGATVFPGNEGIWYHDGWVYFTAKTDHSVHGLDLRNQTYTLLWRGDPDGLGVEGAVLSGVDNITVDAGSGDLFVAEDGGNMELVVITPEGAVAPFARIVGAEHEGSEVTGPCFNPDRTRLYFSSQRGPSVKPLREIIPGVDTEDRTGGVTYEVTGPFRGAAAAQPDPTTTTAVTETSLVEDAGSTTSIQSPATTLAQAASTTAATGTATADDGDGGGNGVVIGIGIGAGVAAVVAAGAVALRRRGERSGDEVG